MDRIQLPWNPDTWQIAQVIQVAKHAIHLVAFVTLQEEITTAKSVTIITSSRIYYFGGLTIVMTRTLTIFLFVLKGFS